MRRLESQSAMEYLMTYGWAILIIAVVLAVLFQLGVFSGGNFLPHAQAGSCQVSRTIAGVSLEGQCNGMLPEYVAQFNGALIGDINKISDANFPSGTKPISIFAWIKSTQDTTYPFIFNYGAYGAAEEDWVLGFYSGQICSDSWTDHRCAGPLVNNGQWHFVGFTYPGSGQNTVVYVDGTAYTGTGSGTPAIVIGGTTITDIGGGTSNNNYTGNIANVQVYNTSLSQSEASALYLEGIGGAPVRPQNLTGWWPLNGNANDYSGNNNNGQLSNAIFSSSWESSYSAP